MRKVAKVGALGRIYGETWSEIRARRAAARAATCHSWAHSEWTTSCHFNDGRSTPPSTSASTFAASPSTSAAAFGRGGYGSGCGFLDAHDYIARISVESTYRLYLSTYHVRAIYMYSRRQGSLLLAQLREGRDELELLGALSGDIASCFHGAANGFWCYRRGRGICLRGE